MCRLSLHSSFVFLFQIFFVFLFPNFYYFKTVGKIELFDGALDGGATGGWRGETSLLCSQQDFFVLSSKGWGMGDKVLFIV